MTTITKRNGVEVPFDGTKIINAINKAFIEVDGQLYEEETAKDIARDIYEVITELEATLGIKSSVESIQDMIEDYLMRSERRDVARAYIRYRYKREVARESNNEFIRALKSKINAEDIENQNANVDEMSFGGRTGAASDLQMKKFALDYCVSDMARKNHENNEIYIHDLSAYPVGSHNCLTIPFDEILARGFNTRQTDVRPARSVNTMCQLVAVVFQLQSLQQFGGVSAGHLDWTAVPYIRMSLFKHYLLEYLKTTEEFYTLDIEFMDEEDLDDWVDLHKHRYLEEMGLEESDFFFGSEKLDSRIYQCALFETRKEIYQAIEGLYHNLNTLQSRSGNQLPFTSINYGTCTLPEGRMFTRGLLAVSIKGLGRLHKTSIFPCGIFQCMKGVNRAPGDPNYDLFRMALESTSRRLYPNYANVDWSNNAGYDKNDPKTYFGTMGCRTANLWDINGLGQQKDGRGNICPVTIILPTLAMEVFSNQTYADDEVVPAFMNLLDKKIHEAKDMLLERFEFICSQPAESAKFMYENGLMAGYDGKTTRSALQHGTLALGQLGLAEALQILVGCDHTKPEGMALAKEIEQLFKDRCAEFKQEYKLNFGVYYTPAENLCYTAMTKFKKRYGKIPNVSDKSFFTNSMHVPVWHQMSPFDKIDIESQLTGYSSAGCITYVELDSTVQKNIDALEILVNYAMDHDIPYFAINVPNDMCLECGYTDEFNDSCPECGSEHIQQLRRVTGYLTGNYTTAFNKGKQDEVENRVRHVGYME